MRCESSLHIMPYGQLRQLLELFFDPGDGIRDADTLNSRIELIPKALKVFNVAILLNSRTATTSFPEWLENGNFLCNSR